MLNVRALLLAERRPLLLRPELARAAPETAAERVKWFKSAYCGGSERTLRRAFEVFGARKSDAYALVEAEGRVPRSLATDFPAFAAAAAEPHLADRTVLKGLPAEATAVVGLLNQARNRLETTLLELASRGWTLDRDALATSLIRSLAFRLISMAAPSLGVALNLARLRRQLGGDTPEARANDFCRRLLQPDYRAEVFDQFPLLDRVLARVAENASDHWNDLLSRLAADFGEIAPTLQLEARSLDRLEVGLGDSHRQGRTVAKLVIAGRTLIYKPRSLGTDLAFQDLAAWAAARTGLDLRTPAVVDFGDHGWMEFIAGDECESDAQVEECHERIGALLCLLYVCGASDVHLENLICRGPHPYFTDLETLAFPDLAMTHAAARQHFRARADSVTRIGYLPNPLQRAGATIDVSAGGSVVAQKIGAMMAPPSLRRDDARAEMKETVLEPLHNGPKRGGKIVTGSAQTEALQRGFAKVYREVLTHRAEWLDPDGPTKRLRGTTFRWIAQGTAVYSDLLRRSLHPRFLRDGIERDFAFAELLRPYGLGAERRVKLASAEIEDLRDADIPYFEAAPDTLDVLDSRGRRLSGIFRRTANQALERRLRGLSHRDLEFQARLIDFAFAAPALRAPRPIAPWEPLVTGEMAPLEAAYEIGVALQRSVNLAGGAPTWVGVKRLDVSVGAAAFTREDLYDGAAGIGIFLAELARLAGDASLARLARKCRRTLRGGVSPSAPIGAYDGLAGSLYADLRMGAALGEVDFDFARATLRALAQSVSKDRRFDVIGGAAGVALVASAAASIPALRDLALDVTVLAANRLRDTVEDLDDAVAWRVPGSDTPLTGFSHGTTGIALALANASSLTSDRTYADLAWRALRYDDRSIDPSTGEWRDLRNLADEHAHGHTHAWCHGDPGIVLALQSIAALRLKDMPPSLEGKIAAGLERLQRRPMPLNHCLCHGALGNLEPLLASTKADRALALTRARQLIGAAATRGAWSTDIALPIPGLMTGLAGIGHGLLRVAADDVPSVLTLGLGATADPVAPAAVSRAAQPA